MHQVLIRPVSSFNLAFGLNWHPLISGRASSAARRIARQRRASHIVLDGQSPASFGSGVLRAGKRWRRQVLHSAAQNVARLYPTGSVACILDIDCGYWLVAVHEGAVMARADIVYRTLEQAQQALSALQRSHTRLVVLRPGHDAPTLQTIAKASAEGTMLQDTGRRRRQWLTWLSLLVMALLVLVWWYRSWVLGAAQAAQPALGAEETATRWNQAVAAVEQHITLHGVAATHAILQHIHSVPAQLSGWALARVACQADAALWRCTADLDRRHPHANNDGLLNTAPSAWRLSFPSIDRASAAWEFPAATQAAGPGRVKSSAYNRRHLQSAWQGIRPAFGSMVLGQAAPVEISAPLDDEGRPLPRPLGLPQYIRSPVQFEGPLRSVSLLLPHTHAIGWRSVALVVGAPVPPSMASSRLRITFHGDLYELLDAQQS